MGVHVLLLFVTLCYFCFIYIYIYYYFLLTFKYGKIDHCLINGRTDHCQINERTVMLKLLRTAATRGFW